MIYIGVMASSKYAAHKSMVKLLSYLFNVKVPVSQKELIRTVDINNPYQLMSYLRKNEYVSTKETNGVTTISISKKGKQKLLKYDLDSLEIKKPKFWDKKWRLVFFDIPEKHKSARNILSAKLKELGFKSIQKSVYIHPYPCLDEIEFIRTSYRIRNYVFLATLEEMEGEKRLRKLFKLPK